MNERFIRAFYFTLKNEGGLSDDPQDPGGTTKYGISLEFLNQLFKKGTIEADINQDGRIDKEDIKLLNIDFVKRAYHEEFWKKIEKISDDYLAIKLFDSAVNLGLGQAVKLLQDVLGVAKDGILGPVTINALSKNNINSVIRNYVNRLICFYSKLAFFNPKLNKFLKGWINRAKRMPNHEVCNAQN